MDGDAPNPEMAIAARLLKIRCFLAEVGTDQVEFRSSVVNNLRVPDEPASCGRQPLASSETLDWRGGYGRGRWGVGRERC